MNLAQLRNNVRLKSDERLSGFLTDSDVTDLVNQGYVKVYNEIVQTYEGYFIEEGTALNGGLFTTIDGVDSYPLPSTLHKLVKVEVQGLGNSNDWFRVNRFSFNNDSNGSFGSSVVVGLNGISVGGDFALTFDVVGNKLKLRPISSLSQSIVVRLWFVPTLTPLSADLDVPVLPSMFHTCIAEYATIQCLTISGEKIAPERMAIFKDELASLIRFIDDRVYQPETMTFPDAEEPTVWGPY